MAVATALEGGGEGLGSDRDHCEVEVFRDVTQGPVPRRATDRDPRGVHGEGRAGEVRATRGQGSADRILLGRSGDEHDPVGLEDPPHRGDVGHVLARLDGGPGDARVVEIEQQLHHAVFELVTLLEAGQREHAEHEVVDRQHARLQVVEAPSASALAQVLEEQAPDPAALVGVVDEERELGDRGIGQAVVATDPHHRAALEHDECLAASVVDRDEPPSIGLVQLPLHAEVAEVPRPVGGALVERDQRGRIRRLGGPDGDHPAISGEAVGGPGRQHGRHT